MAPHDPDLRKEARRHAGPLIGITAALVFAAIAFFWWIGTEGSDETEGSPVVQQPAEPAE